MVDFFVCKLTPPSPLLHLSCPAVFLPLFAHDSSLPVAYKVFQLIHALVEHLLCAQGMAVFSMTLNKSLTPTEKFMGWDLVLVTLVPLGPGAVPGK